MHGHVSSLRRQGNACSRLLAVCEGCCWQSHACGARHGLLEPGQALTLHGFAGDSHNMHLTSRHRLPDSLQHMQNRRPCNNSKSFGHIPRSVSCWAAAAMPDCLPCVVLAVHRSKSFASLQVRLVTANLASACSPKHIPPNHIPNICSKIQLLQSSWLVSLWHGIKSLATAPGRHYADSLG